MRRVFLDTETTGLSPENGHRIIEIAAIAYEDATPISPEEGGLLHLYINPERDIDAAAQEVHNLDSEFLSHQPVFATIAKQVANFLTDSHLYIHNAKFDVGFINSEFKRLELKELNSITHSINCTLEWSRINNKAVKTHSLDSLCHHFGVDLKQRKNGHSAIVDTRLLAQVYFLMTQQQATMDLSLPVTTLSNYKVQNIIVQNANKTELSEHEQYLQTMLEETQTQPLFL